MGKRTNPPAKIQNDRYRMVSFCKRRNGLFKKARELSALTGAHTAVFVVSAAGRPYATASSDVIEKFLSGNGDYGTSVIDDGDSTGMPSVGELLDAEVGDYGKSATDSTGAPWLGELLDVEVGDYGKSAIDGCDITGAPWFGELLDAEVGDYGKSAIDSTGAPWFSELLDTEVGDYGKNAMEGGDSTGAPWFGELLDSEVGDCGKSAIDGGDSTGAAAWVVGQLLEAEVGDCEGLEELCALKEDLEKLREGVCLAWDLQFVNSVLN